MNLIVRPENTSHWYRPSGEPMHSIEMKTRPGEMRPTTLADARKLGLVPSITNIISVIRQPQLEDWKIEQAILAALSLPRGVGEDVHDFAQRARVDSEQEGKQAAALGTEIHSAVANFEANRVIPDVEPHRASVLAWEKWRKANIAKTTATEKMVAHNGIAGCIDFVGVDTAGLGIIIDYKTQDTKPGKKAAAYETWGLQLAGYAALLCAPNARLLNIILSRSEPGRLDVHDWTPDAGEMVVAFGHLYDLWTYLKNYDPRNPQTSNQKEKAA